MHLFFTVLEAGTKNQLSGWFGGWQWLSPCSFCPHRPFLVVWANSRGGGHYLVSLPNRTLIPLAQGSTFLIPKHTFLYQIQTHLDSGLQHMNGAGANIQSITEIMLWMKNVAAISVQKRCCSRQAITLRPPQRWALRELRIETGCPPSSHQPLQPPPDLYPEGTQDEKAQDTGPRWLRCT